MYSATKTCSDIFGLLKENNSDRLTKWEEDDFKKCINIYYTNQEMYNILFFKNKYT